MSTKPLTRVVEKINAIKDHKNRYAHRRKVKLFISFSTADIALVGRLVDRLRNDGFRVWWAEDLEPGEYFRKRIKGELEVSHKVVVIWSAASIQSKWVIAEAGRAEELEKLLPLKTNDISINSIPFPFSEKHTLKIDHYKRLVTTLDAGART